MFEKLSKIIIILIILLVFTFFIIKGVNASAMFANYIVFSKDNTNYIKNVAPNTSVKNFKLDISTLDNINIFKNSQKVSDSSIVSTGMYFTINFNNYYISVMGDINGNGKSSITDLALLKQILVSKISRSGAYYQSADINLDGKITITDLSSFKQFIIGKKNLSALSIHSTDSGISYTQKNNEITIKTCNQTSESVTIPSLINGYPVTAIDNRAFSNLADAKIIILPNTIKSISPLAFNNCSKLENISINNSYYKSINGVLYNSSANEIVRFPEGKTSSEYFLNSNVSKIYPFAFYNSKIENLVIVNDNVHFDTTSFISFNGAIICKKDSKLNTFCLSNNIKVLIDEEAPKIVNITVDSSTGITKLEATDNYGIAGYKIVESLNSVNNFTNVDVMKSFDVTINNLKENVSLYAVVIDTFGNISNEKFKVLISGKLPLFNHSISGKVIRKYEDTSIVVSVENYSIYYITKIWLKDPAKQVCKATADWGKTLNTVNNMLNATSGAIVGCAGSGFYLEGSWEPKSGSPILNTSWNMTSEGHLVISNGKILRKISGYKCNALLGILPNGSFKYYENNPYEHVKNDGVQNTFTFGPPLILNGKKYVQSGPRRGYTSNATRSLTGQVDSNNFIIITTQISDSLNNIRKLGFKLKCDFLYNLDGGGSTSLWFRPSVSGKGIQVYNSSRKVADSLYFKSLN